MARTEERQMLVYQGILSSMIEALVKLRQHPNEKKRTTLRLRVGKRLSRVIPCLPEYSRGSDMLLEEEKRLVEASEGFHDISAGTLNLGAVVLAITRGRPSEPTPIAVAASDPRPLTSMEAALLRGVAHGSTVPIDRN